MHNRNKIVLFDIIHPANVHYFKFVIRQLIAHEHEVIITARQKEITYVLLKNEGFSFIKMGKNPKSTIGKVLFFIYCEIRMFFLFLKYRPSISVSFGSSYLAHNAFIFRKIHISLDDTEHAYVNRNLYLPFSDLVITPASFRVNLGKKHIRFPGHMELFYLNPKYFIPDRSIYEFLKINREDKYVFIRFVSWSAFHDIGQSGLSNDFKVSLVENLAQKYKVFVSSEGDIPKSIQKYKLTIPPHLVHHVLFYAEFFIGEGATMASECAALGTPAIYINTLSAGTLEEQERLGLIYKLSNEKDIMDKIAEIESDQLIKEKLQHKIRELEKERIDLPCFLTWLIENYPESKNFLLANRNSWIEKFKNMRLCAESLA